MNPADYFNSPNTLFKKAAWMDEACEKISVFVKARHSIGWDGNKFFIYIHSSYFDWFWHRHITGLYKDTERTVFIKEKLLQTRLRFKKT